MKYLHSGNLHPPSDNAETRRPGGPNSIPPKRKENPGINVAGWLTYRRATGAPPVLHLRVGLELEIVHPIIIAYPAFPKYVTIVGTDGLVSPPLVYCLFICSRLLVDPIGGPLLGGPLLLVLGLCPPCDPVCDETDRHPIPPTVTALLSAA
jgi:hypothetical protein